MKTSDLTSKVVAFREIPNFNMDDSIDWAIEMLMLGYETESLLILAGISKPANFYEASRYLERSLVELNIPTKNGEAAIMSYCSFAIQKIARGVDVRENLEVVYNCYQKTEAMILFDFCLLYWAYQDLIEWNQTYTPYWETANGENIDQISSATAKEWLDKSPLS